MPLETLAKTAFGRCQRAKEGPAAYDSTNWTKWPEHPSQDLVLKFLEEIVPCLINLVEKEHGYVTHGQRQIHARTDMTMVGFHMRRKQTLVLQ